MLTVIQALVKSQGHLVLATCAGGEPHTSLMSYAAAPGAPVGCAEFWLATLTSTRKYQNLLANPVASLLIDDRTGESVPASPGLALTVDARLEPFESAQAEQKALLALQARHPGLAGFLGQPVTVMLRFVGVRYQLLSGLLETFFWEPEKSA